jgi:solute:Na+ symporter, SSS family
MNLTPIDWIILAAFALLLLIIAAVTRRMTKSVAGFLSAERCAGRYLLTIASGMTFLSTIGLVGLWESGYRNGLALLWWGLMSLPINLIVAMSGWVTYRYRQTRSLTMAQFLEKRYSRRFRIFAGFMAFFSGVLNCAVFPMVTARCLIYFTGAPATFELIGLTFSSFHCVMFVMVATAVLLAAAGGQITVMVSDFFMGTIANVACLAIIGFVIFKIGTGEILDTLLASETVNATANPENLANLTRVQGTSLLNPFKLGKLPDFGIFFFIMLAFTTFLQTGVWQGGAGYLTAARTPHEGKMGNVLGQWRWMVFQLMIVLIPAIIYTVMWNPAFEHLRPSILSASGEISDPMLQARMFVPLALGKLLPAGLLGLFLVLLIGASVSTDDAYYHSWGSTFLQDVIMPLRKKPFTPDEHIKYLRWSIVGVGTFAFTFSCIWELRDYIQMWFQITGSIYVGGACCAVIGGLYWSRGTTQGAWAGMITGSMFSVTGIVLKQIWPNMSIGETVLNGQHLGLISIGIAISVYIIVSLLTCRTPCDMDQLLHRGKYAVQNDQAVQKKKVTPFARAFGVTDEFSRGDKLTFFIVNLWIVGWATVFIGGLIWNLTQEVPSTSWRWWWGTVHLPLLFVVAGLLTVWLTAGSVRDFIRLIRDLRTHSVDEHDDGTVQVHLGTSDDPDNRRND